MAILLNFMLDGYFLQSCIYVKCSFYVGMHERVCVCALCLMVYGVFVVVAARGHSGNPPPTQQPAAPVTSELHPHIHTHIYI